MVHDYWGARLWRYAIPAQAGGVELDGGLDEVFNLALVVYERRDGVPASVVASGTVAELSARGELRATVVDVTGRGAMSESAAASAGLSELTKADAERTSGSVRVRVPVVDNWSGRRVMPWELRAGGMVRAWAPRDQPLVSNIVSTGLQGAGSYRATGVVFDVGSNTATVDLDGGSRSLFRRKRKPSAPKPIYERPGKALPGQDRKPRSLG